MITIFLAVFLSNGCAQEQDLKDVKITYGANSRGYNRVIEIENGKFTVVSNRDENPAAVTLSEEQWNKIADLYAKIDLKTFNDLEGATMERAHDGKAHADMTITVKDKKYTTKGFDHTIPPAQIKEFVDYINELADNSVVKNPIAGSYSVESLLSKDIKDKDYFISFEQDKISGFMGCNLYSGTYEVNDSSISIGALAATRKYCQNEMDYESTWMKIASEVNNFQLEDKTISLFDSDNKLLLKATKK
ncbi:META domain-containing protein [Flavobacterium ardleyense]|uniref:META domain-containing protein n=1 Tax=Flavobacterium ardleyense TaxID=2038737 RepID=A0ABW5Z704_9FLAO